MYQKTGTEMKTAIKKSNGQPWGHTNGWSRRHPWRNPCGKPKRRVWKRVGEMWSTMEEGNWFRFISRSLIFSQNDT